MKIYLVALLSRAILLISVPFIAIMPTHAETVKATAIGPSVASHPIDQKAISVSTPASVAGSLVQIKAIHASSNAVSLTALTSSITVTANSQAGPCVAGIYVNGQPSGALIPLDNNPPPVNSPYPSMLTITFKAPGTYEIEARQPDGLPNPCSGVAKTTVVVSADSNWPCNLYSGYVKQTGGLLGADQFMCVPASMPVSVAPMNCTGGSFFVNLGPMFGCTKQDVLNILVKPH